MHAPAASPPLLTADRPAKAIHRRPTDLIDRPDAIVIGSGIGGLGVASFLSQKRGYTVLVLEAQDVPGGSTHPHEYEGFEFPSGLHSVGDMNAAVGRGMNRPNFDLATGGKLEWSKMPEVHEVCTYGDDHYEWFSDIERNIDWTSRRFPGQGDVRAYYAMEDRIEGSAWAWALTKVYPEWVPASVREGLYKMTGSRWRTSMKRNTTDVFTTTLGFSPKLASVFSYMYGNYGRLPNTTPFGMHATFLAHYRHGAYYPVGGPGQIAQCILPIVEATGGQVAVRTPASQIIVEGGRAVGVKLESGEQIRAPLIISDAGAHTTYADLLDRDVAVAHGLVERIGNMRSGTAFLYLLLGYDEALDLPRNIFWQMATGPDIDPYDIPATDAYWKSNMQFDNMACYLLSPSARDASHAQRYPGKSTIMALAEARPEWVARVKTDPVFKADFEARVTESLMKIIPRHMPAAAGKTPTFVRAGTPAGCNPRAWGDSAVGLALGNDRFFSQTHWLRPQTPIKGLFLTGQDSFLPGICGSLLAARFTYAAAVNDPFFLLP